MRRPGRAEVVFEKMWDGLKNKVGALPSYVDLLEELCRPGASVDVTGLYGSARAPVLAGLARQLGDTLMIVTPDHVRARDVEEDLRVFGMENVILYPEDEMLPYDYHDPDRNLTGLQMKALEVLVAGGCGALVCTLRSALKKVFTPAHFRKLVLSLGVGEEHEPLDLAAKLLDLGYERHEVVEEKGQFALRGGIMDFFEVGEEGPVRMEFDGDILSSMRDFDIETQRSQAARGGMRVRPLYHLAPTRDGIERFRRRLEKETLGFGADERERMMLAVERLESGIHFFGMEHYAAAVHEVVPITDYFERPPLLVIYDAEEVEGRLGEFMEEVKRRYCSSRKEGHFYPEPDEAYVMGEGLEEVLHGERRLMLRGLGWKGGIGFGARPPGDFRRNLKGLVREVKKEIARGVRVFLFCANEFQRERAEEVLSDVSLDIDFPIGNISSGFKWPEIGVTFLSEYEVFGRYHRPFRAPRARSRSLTYDHSHLKPGDFIVHLNHGVGRYMGLRVLEIEGMQTECLDIRYAGDDHLFIPVAQLRMVEKHLVAEGAEPAIDRLGSAAWAKARERARKNARKVAKELLEIYAARQIAEGFAFEPDRPWQKELEASFPYEETPHQLETTEEVKLDMEAERPMDRLLCGDVGFGKTEVAVRAAFKTVLSGKQCALLVPTTVLAMQHYNTLKERLKGFPVDIRMLSRFVSQAGQKNTVKDLAEGRIDIVVGTHRMLSKDIGFKDLGLLIIDEEHRFGVKHKETFKKIKRSVDVLSMTATPIPRTLSMAVSGIREISVIDTPPRNRLPIHTEILPFDEDCIRDAVLREIDRGGQVFFVHNRVQSIGVMAGYLERLLPDRVRISCAHGQMRERELEERMIGFLDRRFDVLVCTMIIEAGLDFPNVNTIIINRADKLGLAQLYQLRGRVGRSDRKAFAYLLVPRGGALTPGAVSRLQAISEFDYLGAGYRIAMRDLEIRGAGNLLGHEQSGHINAVGLDLYTRMLKEEVARLKGEESIEREAARISIPIPSYLPESYIRDSEERMDIYRRLSRMENGEQVEEMRDELRDRFGRLPPPAENLLRVVDFRVGSMRTGIERLDVDEEGAIRAVFSGGAAPGRNVLGSLAEAFEGRLAFYTERGFSLRISPVGAGGMKGGSSSLSAGTGEALEAIGKLLNLLEFYDN